MGLRLSKLYILLVVFSVPFNYLLGYIYPSLNMFEFTIIEAILCSAIVVLLVFAISGLLAGLLGLMQRKSFPYIQVFIGSLWLLAHLIPFVGMYVLEPSVL
ncbi:hypothetical protein [Agaribacterium sp. ZY112]|uniref:hypothetical protein n=1 Tax=Agaribacterium sp. ZY112 TaxID=3233574 RepID=UPI00352382B6